MRASGDLALTGNEAVAHAMRQIAPDVVAAYPITPQTDIVTTFARFVADGEVDTEFLTVESEHSALSAVIGSAAGGARTMTATSSQGFALMWELLYVAASYRLPIVMTNVNRALSGPINIHCDHSDSMGGRDGGWLQLYAEDQQEAYDNVLMAVKVAERADVRLPVMTMMDGYVISGALARVRLLPDAAVREFTGPYRAINPLLDGRHPVTVGPFDGLHGWYFEHKVRQNEAMARALDAIEAVAEQYAALTGRRYGLLDPYRIEDADLALVVVGSAAGAVRAVVDELRARGLRAGMVRVRAFRPFPARAYAAALGGCRAIGVLDRSDSFGAEGGPLFLEVRSALYEAPARPRIVPFIYGLGGRDLFPRHVEEAFAILREGVAGGHLPVQRRYLNLREE